MSRDAQPNPVPNVWVVPISCIADARGCLHPVHFTEIGITPVRAFLIDGVPAGTSRGGHAHRTATQLFMCLSGRVRLDLRYRGVDGSLLLESASDAVLVGPGVWARQTYLEANSRLFVLCDEEYAESSYIAEDS